MGIDGLKGEGADALQLGAYRAVASGVQPATAARVGVVVDVSSCLHLGPLGTGTPDELYTRTVLRGARAGLRLQEGVSRATRGVTLVLTVDHARVRDEAGPLKQRTRARREQARTSARARVSAAPVIPYGVVTACTREGLAIAGGAVDAQPSLEAMLATRPSEENVSPFEHFMHYCALCLRRDATELLGENVRVVLDLSVVTPGQGNMPLPLERRTVHDALRDEGAVVDLGVLAVADGAAGHAWASEADHNAVHLIRELSAALGEEEEVDIVYCTPDSDALHATLPLASPWGPVQRLHWVDEYKHGAPYNVWDLCGMARALHARAWNARAFAAACALAGCDYWDKAAALRSGAIGTGALLRTLDARAGDIARHCETGAPGVLTTLLDAVPSAARADVAPAEVAAFDRVLQYMWVAQ